MSEWTRRKGIQLAAPYEEKRLISWKPPWVIQPKLNGERGRALFDNEGRVTLLSSEENYVTGIPHILAELEQTGLTNCELDGEFYLHGMPFSQIHSIVSRDESNLRSDYTDMEYWVFDVPDEQTTQDQRLFNLNYVFENYIKSDKIRRVPGYVIDTVEAVDELLEIFHYQQHYEGFILRNLEKFYHRGRKVDTMMKFKPGKEDIYEIVSVVEAVELKTKKPKGMVGAFICRTDKINDTFPIGAGRIKHPERIELWKMRELLPGKRVHVAYQHLTSKRGVPRNGRALEVLWS